jgi:uncharacterized protein YndB with AHSA1/START domain
MNLNYINEQILISVNPFSVWKVLTDEKEFRNCFGFLKLKCNEWRVGGKMEFLTDRQTDYAIIIEFEKPLVLSYHYYKFGSETPIYTVFSISETEKNISEITIKGSGFKDNEERIHTISAWKNMLQTLKKYLEQN